MSETSEPVLFPDPTKAIADQADSVVLALTLYGEARGEGQKGQEAVAHVILNRVARARAFRDARGRRHPLFGDASVAGACLAPWQFSCWNKGDPNREKLVQAWTSGGASLRLEDWVRLWTVAREALDGATQDPTKGSTHYCTLSLWGDDENPRAWHSKASLDAGLTHERARIGAHVFGVTA